MQITEPETHQHTVSQFLLRHFATGKRNKQVFAYDKKEERSFKTSVRNVTSVGGFYDVEINGSVLSLDPVLQKIEDLAVPVIEKIVNQRILRNLGNEERGDLALFIATQLLRTNAQRRQYKHLNEIMRDFIVKGGHDPDQVQNFKVFTDEEAKAGSIALIPQLAPDFTIVLLKKSWVLFSTSMNHAFYISDNPVTMHNTMNQSSVRGTLGLGVEGIEVYFPITSTLSLGLLCPSIEDMVRKGHQRATDLKAPVSMEQWVAAFDGSATWRLDPENVKHHNSLQVINAEQYVFSERGDFRLIQEMLRTHPELRLGPRVRTAG